MEAFFESPEWNDIKKILSASSRDLLALSISNVLLLLELYLPEWFDAKVAFLDLIHNKQLLVWKVGNNITGFIMADIYTQEYEQYYKNYPLLLNDNASNPLDDEITSKIDLIRKNKIYKKALASAKEKREQAYKTLTSFDFS